MSNPLLPYCFVPQYKHVIWGGTRIGAFKGVDLGVHTHVGESWELSGLEGHESVVATGPEAGMPLSELIARHGEWLVGRRVLERYGTRFPLLFKFIDARRDLSVQVHPGDEMARRLHGCMGKSEMWYVVDAEPGSHIAAGVTAGHDVASVASLLRQRRVAEALAIFDTRPGDVFDLPAGSLHMIGAGNLIAEVQQASDITYRVWDYDRVDADGRRRELHTELALEAFRPERGGRLSPREVSPGVSPLVNNSAFAVTLLNVEGTLRLDMADDACRVLMTLDAPATLMLDGGVEVEMGRGQTWLVPAAARVMQLSGTARLLCTTPC